MLAATLTNNSFTINTQNQPEPRADELLVRTIACGVCSGDLFLYQNRADITSANKRLGHEASGEVVAVGEDVSEIKPGDIVTSLSYPAYSEFFISKPTELVKLPPEIDTLYALGEPVACCVHAADRFAIQPGAKVAVVGCGFMGLICLQLAKYQGAGLICAFDLIAERLEMSRQVGADFFFNVLDSDSDDIIGELGHFDVVIEAAGSQSAVDLCGDLVAQHGQIALIGYHQSNSGLRTVNMQQWNYKAIDVVNGHVRRQDEKIAAMQKGMDLLQKGVIDTKSLSTLYDFEDIDQAFVDLAAGKSGLYKAVLRMAAKQ